MKKKHAGSCHCGAVRFTVELEDDALISRCNCSICTKAGIAGTNVKPEAFELLSGEASLGSYEFGHKVSRRRFCTRCGIYCFSTGHLKELGGDFVSVSANALDDLDLANVKIVYWDGRHDNWNAGPRDMPWPIDA